MACRRVVKLYESSESWIETEDLTRAVKQGASTLAAALVPPHAPSGSPSGCRLPAERPWNFSTSTRMPSPALLSNGVQHETDAAAPSQPLPMHASPTTRLSYRQETSLSPGRSSYFSRSLSRMRLLREKEPSTPSPSPQRSIRDFRAGLPRIVSRFLGWRLPEEKAPFAPLFAWQRRIPVKVENSVLSCIGAFLSIVIIESVMIRSELFHAWGGPPLVIASLGASAVLLFSTFESPLAQPRNAMGGQVLSALVGIIVVRLVTLSPSFVVTDPPSREEGFARLDWLAAALAMSLSLLVMELTGTVHPPGGATGLIVATQGSAVNLQWRFLLVIFASVAIMIGLALIVDNLGRRRYPTYFWSPVEQPAKDESYGRSGQRDVELERQGRPIAGVGEEVGMDELERRGRKPREGLSLA